MERIAIRLIGMLLLAAAQLAASEIRGIVRDIYGRPLPGITVRVGEGGDARVTDEQGRFTLMADDSAAPLQLTFESPLYYREKRTLGRRELADQLAVFLIPIRLLKEEVTVTALNESENAVTAPFAQSVVSAAAIEENQPETVVQSIQSSPGVHFIGKGGIAVTPSIRGLARRRVLLLAEGARITSDRSAGASAHFLPPEWVGRIEVLRSGASVLYGSDAIGGVIQVFPVNDADPSGRILSLNLSGSSLDGRVNGGLSLAKRFGGIALRAAFQAAQAGDYSAAGERILRSGYRTVSGELAVSYERAARSFRLRFLKSAGRDVGKPERANDPAVASFYPQENANLLTVAYREGGWVRNGSLELSAYLNANDYQLNKEKQDGRQTEISRNDAFDFGGRVCLKKEPGGRLAYQLGIDFYGRGGVDMQTETWKNGAQSAATVPVLHGRRGDLGAYAVLTYSAPARFDLIGGARLGAFRRQAVANGELLSDSSVAPAFFLGVTRRMNDALTLFLNAGTAFRMPSLSEAFYTGITGRSSIIGNPGLDPERSVNLDAGIKFHRRGCFLGAYLFQYSIRDMIEKFPLGNSAYTYENIERGRIRGLELEFQLQPLARLEFFGNAFAYRGVSTASGGPLNDVPSAKLLLGAKLWRGRFWMELDWLASAAQKRPGPAEVPAPGYQVTDAKAGYYFSDRLAVFFKAANLFDRAYFANADPDIPLAKGLDLSLGLRFSL